MIKTRHLALRGFFSLSALLPACSIDTEPTGEVRELADASTADAETEAPELDASPPAHDAGRPKGPDDAGIPPVDASAPADAGDAASAEEDGGAGLPYPALLSETGLYEDIGADQVKADVRAFAPRYALWSDAAKKRRWFKLPRGKQI